MLLEDKKNSIYIINRGKKYWNHSYKNQESIKFYYGDRSEYVEF